MKRIFQKFLGWSLMLALPLVMTSCEEIFAWLDNPVTPTIQVLRAQLTLKVGESKPLRATTQDHVVLLYSSGNPAVATVDAEGVVTAIAEGTTTITIKAQGEDDYYRTEIFSENTTTVEVTVSKNDGSISFATANVPKYINDAKFTNTLTIDGDGVVTYTSDNTTVAEVDATTGEVTIKGAGTANIKATTTNTNAYTYETNTAQYALTVDPAISLASITADYIVQNGDVLTGTLAGNYKISIAAGATIELKDATINGNNDANYKWAGLTCLGNANIIITGTNCINGFHSWYPAIQAGPESSLLTINGTGSLTATGGNFAAGIGSALSGSCGNITIDGTGSLTATGGYFAAGIGSGDYGSCGIITINGGIVTASSVENGAGIGSGFNQATCGNITINGGTITASSSANGAGIGSGYSNSSCSNISINGGTVTASSGYNGAGIGSGYSNSSCKNITISGGDITASSGQYGAGIGSGYLSSFGGISITSGITKVTATTNHTNAWPIGKGNLDNSLSSSAVIIGGATVTSKSWDGSGMTGLTLTGAGTNTWTLTSTTAP